MSADISVLQQTRRRMAAPGEASVDIHQVVAMARHVHDAEGMNFGASSTRDQRNAHWARIIGIVHHGHAVYNATPDPQWHLKRASPTRPPSDDVAVSMPSRHFWDCITSSGSNAYRFEPSGDHGPLPSDQIVFAPPVPADGGGVQIPQAPVLGDQHRQIIEHFAARFAPALDRTWMRRLAEQMAHTFQGEGWGCKSADPTRPQSPNVLAREANAHLFGYNLLPGTGDVLVAQTPPMDLTGQVFIAVTASDHLGAPAPGREAT
jgi:hypothetical protein